MPSGRSFYFYAAKTDALAVLRFAVEELECDVYEQWSEYDCALRQFATIEAVDAAFGLGVDHHGHGSSVMLSLWSPRFGGPPTARRYPLQMRGRDAKYSFHERFEGFGLLQLQFGGVCAVKQTVTSSWFSHNTVTRAEQWAPVVEGDTPERWNWEEIERASRAFRKYVRSLAESFVGNFGPFRPPVLPEAQSLLATGYTAGN